jgi:REP element-mobilizing transposase RayT
MKCLLKLIDHFGRLHKKIMETGQTYHVFNHANGREDLFPSVENYHHFLGKMHRHLSGPAEILAFCLIPNHFHLAVKIPEKHLLEKMDSRFSEMTEEEAGSRITKRFSNLFSSHTLSVNRMYGRTGSLFRPNMKTKQVDDESSLCKLIHYIHCNPVHHGLVKNMEDWPYSSFSMYKSMRKALRSDDEVLKAFGGYEQFIRYHEQPIELKISDTVAEGFFLKMTTPKKRAGKILDLP